MRYRAEYAQSKRVSDSGAQGGCILTGAAPHNVGLRVKVFRDQPKGDGGPIKGQFQILDAGTNKHSDSLQRLLGLMTDADEVIAIIRRAFPGCVSVVNANILTVEGGQR
jgi:hypothetical protein